LQVSALKIKFPPFPFQNPQKALLRVSKPFDKKGVVPQAGDLNHGE